LSQLLLRKDEALLDMEGLSLMQGAGWIFSKQHHRGAMCDMSRLRNGSELCMCIRMRSHQFGDLNWGGPGCFSIFDKF